jgi:hypothetical protein
LKRLEKKIRVFIYISSHYSESHGLAFLLFLFSFLFAYIELFFFYSILHSPHICIHNKNEKKNHLEKAYMKLNGGYDFPGSNSGIDLYALTGWLPEVVSLKNDLTSTESEKVWGRLESAHRFGDCLITIATGVIEEGEAERSGLVPTHAYAVKVNAQRTNLLFLISCLCLLITFSFFNCICVCTKFVGYLCVKKINK